MNLPLILAFLFFIGSSIGWALELMYRRFFSKNNPERKWINPGFCTGPYLPLYGCGLCILYLVASVERYSLIEDVLLNKLCLFLFMAICMTGIEYVAGVMALKLVKVRLWDYRREWGNLQGLICPKFSLYWAILGALYYFLVHPHILDALAWLSNNLAFSFVIGFFFGIFVLDVSHSLDLTMKLRRYAKENNVIIRYEALKANIRTRYQKTKQKYHFFRPFKSDLSLREHLKELRATLEERHKK